ncbi:MAG: hypothetical protein ACR2GU_15160 [Rubrobacteraceae bacterium]
MATKESRVQKRDARKQFTVTVPHDLGRYLEERAAETGMNKSAVVSEALEVDRQRRKEILMREGYEEMAGQHLELVREFELAPHTDESTDWPDY